MRHKDPRPLRDDLERLYATLDLQGIAQYYNVSPSSVHRWMVEYGISRRTQGLTRGLPKPRSDDRYRDAAWMRRRYETEGTTIEEIAKELGAGPRTIWYWLKVHGIEARTVLEASMVARSRFKYKTGAAHPGWKGGRFVNKRGYVCVWVPERKRYVLEHRMVMKKTLGRPLRIDEVVHHINGVKTDNRIENLVVLPPNKHSPVMQYEARIRILEAEVGRLRAELAQGSP